MGWMVSLGVALLTGIVGMFGSGLVAALAVDWYHISSFEGGSGFFVVGMALVGLLAGSSLGLIVARVVAARPRPAFLKALGAACGTVVVILAATAGIAHALADIPPEIGGEQLFLQVELKWPATGAPAPRDLAGTPRVTLGTANGSTIRRQEDGPLFVDDARQVDGRSVVPGAVRIFTSRGQRIVDIGIGDTKLAGFLVPLRGHPNAADREWSDWLPRAREGSGPLPDQFTYRFRVSQLSEPLRRETIGPFEIRTTVAISSRLAEPTASARMPRLRSSSADSRCQDSSTPGRWRSSADNGPACSFTPRGPTAWRNATSSPKTAAGQALSTSANARRRSKGIR